MICDFYSANKYDTRLKSIFLMSKMGGVAFAFSFNEFFCIKKSEKTLHWNAESLHCAVMMYHT